MRPLRTAIFAVLFAVASPLLVFADSQPVREDLATMVEEVGAQTGLSFNIGASTPTSVNINQVNGRSVCSAEARADVERLQRAFDAHRSIYKNIGPVLITITDRSGKKTSGDRAKLEKDGILKGCPNIYVSVHE
jgi:hypothetical protein